MPQRGSPQRGSGRNSRNLNHLSHHNISGPSEWGTSNNLNSHQHHYPPPPPTIRNHYDNYQHQQEMIRFGVPKPDYMSIHAQAPNLRNVGGATINFVDIKIEVLTTKYAAELQAAGTTEGVANTVHTNHSKNYDDQDDYNHDHDEYDDKYDDDKDIQTSIGGVNDVSPHLDTVEKAKDQHTNASAYPNVDMTNYFLCTTEDIKQIGQMEHDAMKMFPDGDRKKTLIIKQF